MAKYRVTDPQTGRQLIVTGDSPPTEQELENIFASQRSPSPSVMNPTNVKPTTGQRFKDALVQTGADMDRLMSRTLRMGAETIGAPPMMAADFGVASRNLVENAIAGDPLFQKDYEMPSETFASGLDQLGLARPHGIAESVTDFVGQGVLGARLPVPSVRNPVPAATPTPRPPSRAAAVIREGERHGVPVFYDDVAEGSGGAVARRVGVAAEQLPLGTGPGRARQAEAAADAAKRVVASRAPSVGDDVPELIQQGLKTKLNQFRESARRLYDRVSTELDPKGNVTRPGFDSHIKAAQQAQAGRGTLADPRLSALIEKYSKAPQGNFSAMRAMRSDLADDISDFYSGANSTIGAKGVRLLQDMKTALEKDMESFARASGDRAYNAWRMADGFYRRNIVPFRETGFKDLVNSAEPEKAWRYLLAQGGVASRSARMYRSLDEGGRSAVRYGMVRDAFENATNPNGSFSPAKFAKYLEDHSTVVNQFFKGSDLNEIKGFQALMRSVQRAGQYAENPPTGQRLIPILMAGGAYFSPEAVGAATVFAAGSQKLFQTPAGRNLLLGLSRAKDGSPAQSRLAERAARLIVGGAVAARTDGQSNEQRNTPLPETQ